MSCTGLPAGEIVNLPRGLSTTVFLIAAASWSRFARSPPTAFRPAARICARVVALYRIDVGLQLVGQRVGLAEGGVVLRGVEVVGVVQGGQHPLAEAPWASSVPSVRKPGPYSGIVLLRPAAA